MPSPIGVPTSPPYELFVGVDVAAATATVVWSAAALEIFSRPLTITQTADGFAELQQRLRALEHPASNVLVVMEATGTYWVTLATTLVAAGYAVSVVNPAQAHDFAKALLKRSKTDAIDAHTLAQLGALLRPPRWTPPPAIYTELQQRLAQRDTLVDLRQQVRNQLHALIQQPVVIASVRSRMDTLIHELTDQIREIEDELTEVLRRDRQEGGTWAAAAARLQTIVGMGPLTAAWLLVTTLNFTLCQTAAQAAAYAGLVPNAHESGTSVHGRSAIGHRGNARLRRALYLATLSATQHNPVLKAFYERLRTAGKPMKVARCATARKLLCIAWAVVTNDCDFDPTYLAQGKAKAEYA
jgi:transposase